jgi:hypothetical protein
VDVSVAGKDPQWRDAERFAERHARTVLARTDVRVTPMGTTTELDLIGADFAGRVEHRRSPVGRDDLEDLRSAAGASVAVFYSRSGYTKTAVLWAEEHRISLFGYTGTGYAAPVNQCAVELVARGQAESEQHVRVATELVARRATAARQEAERREREAHAEVLRAENEAREAAERRRIERVRSETLLGRTVVLLLAIQLDEHALRSTVERLSQSTLVSAVADASGRMPMSDRPHAVALVRSLFDDGAAALEVMTPMSARDTTSYRATRQSIDRALDALDGASGAGAVGHVAPDAVSALMHQAERCWRALVGELMRAVPAPPGSLVPSQRRPRHLSSTV